MAMRNMSGVANHEHKGVDTPKALTYERERQPHFTSGHRAETYGYSVNLAAGSYIPDSFAENCCKHGCDERSVLPLSSGSTSRAASSHGYPESARLAMSRHVAPTRNITN
jgi:hypothetical protein